MDAEVKQYVNKLPEWQVEVCKTIQKVIHKSIPDVEEKLQYGKPHYLKNGHYAAVIHAAKDKISFMVFNATEIPEVKGFLRSMGNGERKVIDIKEGQQIDYDNLSDLLKKISATL
jgi:hypothetical protein